MPKNNSSSMDFTRKGDPFVPLEVFSFGGEEILGVYQGKLSPFDMLVRYKQNVDGKWTQLRTPKHMHWAMDLMIKKYSGGELLVVEFLDYLLKYWDSIAPLRSEDERNTFLRELKNETMSEEIEKFKELNQHGEYRVEFLITMAKLLMVQEKTNYEKAYMFKNLLVALKDGKDIFKIVSLATHH